MFHEYITNSQLDRNFKLRETTNLLDLTKSSPFQLKRSKPHPPNCRQCSDRSEKPNCRIFPWQCKRLLSEKKAFAPCFKKYPDETRAYVAMCKEDMFDSCKTSQDTYCQNFAEFDRFCQSKGIQVEWRAYTKCREFVKAFYGAFYVVT